MQLNIGCSRDTWGDIRLDISDTYLNYKSSANIHADAQNIPFQDRVFEETKAWNILEHLPCWQQAIKDWCRVTDNKLQIEVPMDAGFQRQELIAEIFSLNFSFISKMPSRRREHLWQFNPQSIIQELQANGFDAKLTYELAPLFFRDENRLARNRFVRFIRQIQHRIPFGYLVTAYRIDP